MRQALARIARSPFVEDVRSRLHIIPETIGGVTLAFGLLFVARGLWVVLSFVGVWCVVALALGIIIGRAIHRRDAQVPVVELDGAELDGQFYGIVAREFIL